MTHYVPDWDDKSHSLRVFEGANLCHIKKGGLHQHQHQLQQSHHLQSLLQENLASALVPNHDVLGTLAHTGLQEDDGTRLTDDGSERSSIPALDVPVSMSNPYVQEDEMLSWLRYPLEDSLDRNYYSEMFGELTNPHVQLVKDVFLQQTMKEPKRAHTLNSEGSAGSEPVGLQQLTNTAGTSCSPRPATKSDAAMALGAGRAAGILAQTGSEAFNEVRTHLNPCALLKSFPSSCMEPSSDGRRAAQSMEPIASAPPVSSGFNFFHFSRPVATTLNSLRLVGAASGPTNVERARQPLVRGSQLPCEHSTGDSDQSMVVSMPSSQQSTEFISRRRPEEDGAVYRLPTNLPCGTVVRGHNEAAELNSQDTCVSVSENALPTTEIAQTTVSPSCLSGSSTEKRPQEVLTPPKRSSSTTQYSEDLEDVAANAKKPPPGPRAVKRSRAAETHNESEKKRRNKINVRLKALQSLIPNSNKTDKASVLDEAIEYTKMLQAQVQFMSMKTGMFFPTMMPPGMHYAPVQQMATFGMGMGMGMDMGIGMHVTDSNAATTVGVGVGLTAGLQGARAVAATLNLSPAPPQPPSSHAYAGARLPQTCSPSPLYDVTGCLPTAHISEPYKVMLAQQSQLQPVLMNEQMNADVYGASLQQRPPEENYLTSAF